MAQPIVFVSKTHQLLPFANRLGSQATVMVWREDFHRAWTGGAGWRRLDASHDENVAEVERLRSEGALVVSDVAGFPADYGVPEGVQSPLRGNLRFGGWIDTLTPEKTTIRSPHFLVVDRGVQAGGLGKMVDAGMTLIPLTYDTLLSEPVVRLQEAVETMAPEGFRGLFQADVVVSPEAGINPGAVQYGWPWLHTHAFLSDVSLDHVPDKLTQWVIVTPLSLSPWPFGRGKIRDGGWAPPRRPIEVARPRSVFWHDVEFREKWIVSAGLDGLLGVAKGEGLSFFSALGELNDVVNGVVVEELQVRMDIGAQVPQVMVGLEKLGMYPGVERRPSG